MINKPTNTTKLIFSTIIAAVIISSIPVTAHASDYSAQQGVTMASGYNLAGVSGSLTVKDSPFISASGVITGHRDYMVYMNLPSGDSVGAGYFAYKDATGVHIYDLTYDYFGSSNVGHNLYRTMTVGQSFTATVQQDSSTSNSWTASTYFGDFNDVAYGSIDTRGANAGSTARNLAYAYSSGVDDMPGYFDVLKTAEWVSGSLSFDKYFSQNAQYKCNALHGYALAYLASYSGTPKIDNVGTGPRDYTVSGCSIANSNSAWDAFGE